jgi:acyl-CoA thioesterase-1
MQRARPPGAGRRVNITPVLIRVNNYGGRSGKPGRCAAILTAIHQMPIEKFERGLRNGLALGRSLGADFVLMNLQYVPAVVAASDKEAYEKIMAEAAKEYGAGLFRRFDIMRGRYKDGMPYAHFVQFDGLHLNDFGQKCIGKLLTRAILNSLNGP